MDNVLPIDYKKYPPNWLKEIRPRIMQRANNTCECDGCDFKHLEEVWAVLCLIHSEVSEALEADRNRSYAMLTEPQRNVLMGWTGSDDFAKDYKDKVKGTFEEEMADIFIRLLDMCAFKGIDIEFHVKAKMRYNLSREKYHGKKY